MTLSRCLVLSLLLLLPMAAHAARERLLLDEGWRFHLGDAVDPARDMGYGAGLTFAKAGEGPTGSRIDFDDSGWRKVNVPHDWAVELPFDPEGPDAVGHGSKPVGRAHPATTIGWYRRTFTLPETDKGRRLSLEFDGVFRDSTVWVNGHFMGRNLSGYTPFAYDITDVARFGGKNVVTLRVDASQFEGWFYEGAGIYRHTWLVKTDPLHVPQYGTYVTSDVARGRATLTIQTDVVNEDDRAANVNVISRIVDAGGRQVASLPTGDVPISAWDKAISTQRITVVSPHLWSIESPYLYRLVTVLYHNGAEVDRVETPFGIRTIRFDPDRGFFLNGKRVELKGTCNHQDHAGVGSALPDRIQSYRIERLKAMGSNAYRTSHNAPTPELLDACDRLGMVVMDEHRMSGSSPEILDQLTTMVRRDRNHPSVIMWSIGNEENTIQGSEVGERIGRSMKRAVLALDRTRPITAAMNGGWGSGFSNVVDVQGFNYGSIQSIDAFHAAHPKLPSFGSETASTLTTRGEYARDPSRSVMPAYDSTGPGWGSTAESWWQPYATRPYLAGGFVWTGFDYRGEPTPYGWPAISSQFGIMDTCGFPKDNFYYYQAWWGDKPVVHILPHWNWPGKEGQPVSVWVHSNADRVELFLNGKSLGVKPMEPNSHVEWSVNYEPGTLEAKGYKGDRVIATDRVETTGPPAAVRLEPDRPRIDADGEDVAMVTFSIRDAQGRTVPVADNEVQFEANGGEIIGVGNGNPASHEADRFVSEPVVRAVEGWRMQTVDSADNRPEVAPDYDDSGWKPVSVTDQFGPMAPNTTAVYRATVDLSAADLAAGLTRLSFGMIDDFGTVYVNGRKIGEANDWSHPFGFEARDALKPGRNYIAVVVRNTDASGGLARGVSLVGPSPQPQYHRRVFNGLGQVIVQASKTAGPITLRATSPGLAPAVLTIEAMPAAPLPAVP